MSAFGDEVKRLAEEKGLTQKALAEACGVNQTFIGKLMRGEKERLGADVLFKLAEALGVDCQHFKQYLLPETETPAEPPAGAKKGKKKK